MQEQASLAKIKDDNSLQHWTWLHKEISEFYKVCYIFHFLGKYIGDVQFSSNMNNIDKFGENIFPNAIFFYLDMSKAF